jgi:hypothetical protein
MALLVDRNRFIDTQIFSVGLLPNKQPAGVFGADPALSPRVEERSASYFVGHILLTHMRHQSCGAGWS